MQGLLGRRGRGGGLPCSYYNWGHRADGRRKDSSLTGHTRCNGAVPSIFLRAYIVPGTINRLRCGKWVRKCAGNVRLGDC